MLELSIPGRPPLRLEHLVLDYNGTLAVDGRLAEGAGQRIEQLTRKLEVHIITADTFGVAAVETSILPVSLQVIGAGAQAEAKRSFVAGLGPDRVCAVGNGANDELMLKQAALSICVLGPEGAAVRALMASQVVVTTPVEALDLLLRPGRLAATLRV